jgi:hypothetical protein
VALPLYTICCTAALPLYSTSVVENCGIAALQYSLRCGTAALQYVASFVDLALLAFGSMNTTQHTLTDMLKS